MANMVAQVNAEMKRRGHAERLRRGRGYYYFCGGESHTWYSSMVMVSQANALTVEQWVREYNRLKGAA